MSSVVITRLSRSWRVLGIALVAACAGLSLVHEVQAEGFGGLRSGSQLRSPTGFGTALYRKEWQDLSVKVRGGRITFNRSYRDTHWAFNENWAELKFLKPSDLTDNSGWQAVRTSAGTGVNFTSVESGNSVQAEPIVVIQRGVAYYEKINDTLYRALGSKRLFIVKTASGWEWRNQAGARTVYSESGRILEAYNSRGVKLTFGLDGYGRIDQVFDHDGTLALSIDYYNNHGHHYDVISSVYSSDTDPRPKTVTDRSGRSVSYTWNDDLLTGYTDVLGQTWTFTYKKLEYHDGYDTSGIGANSHTKDFLEKIKAPDDGNGNVVTVHTNVYQKLSGGYQCAKERESSSTNPITANPTSGGGTAELGGNCDYYYYSPPQTVLAQIKDRDGKGERYGYYFDGKKDQYALTVTDSDGMKTEQVFSLNGDLQEKYLNGLRVLYVEHTSDTTKTHIDEQGLKTEVVYNEFDQVIKKTYPDGSVEAWVYNGRGQVTQHTDTLGVKTVREYDTDGNLTKLTRAAGTPVQQVTTYTYNGYGEMLTKTKEATSNTPAATTTYTYDAHGNVATMLDAEQQLTQYQDYDVMGNAQKRIDPTGEEWLSTYDAKGQMLTSTTPLGRTTSYAYDVYGNRASITAPNNAVTTYGYNGQDRVTQITDSSGKTTSMVRNYQGDVLSVTDADGQTHTSSYDPFGRLISQTDGNGNTTTCGYQNDGTAPYDQPVTVQYPTFSESRVYDNRGRLQQRTVQQTGRPDQVTQYSYDREGRTLTVIDANGKTVSYNYDALGRTITHTDPDGFVTTFGYDARNNLLSVLDAELSNTLYTYDRINRKTSEQRPEGQLLQYSYTPKGQLDTVTDPKGNQIDLDYDDDGRVVTRKRYAAGNLTSAERTVQFQYNPLGQLQSYNDGQTSANYTFNTLGQLTQITQHFGPFSKTVGYSYTDNGQLKTYTDAEGITHTYGYDPSGKLQSIAIPGVGQYTVNDYQWAAPSEITLPGGVKQQYAYTGLLQVEGITLSDSGNNPLMDYGYSYDAVGNITQKATEHGNYDYGYDDLYRLTSATTPTDAEAYSYDKVGNRKTSHEAQGEWHYSANHALQSQPQGSYQYDVNGATTEKTVNGLTQKYAYNADNRLIQVKDGQDAVIATYDYDPFGQRIKKQAQGTTTYFLYTPTGLAGEYDQTGQLIRGYGFKPDSLWTTDPIYLKDSSGTYYFYQNDHLATPQKLIATNGAVVWEATYESFGAAQVNTNTINNPLRFPGQYYDSETNLHYNYHRYYDPQMGRYISSDPIGLSGGLNVYLYVNAQPVIFVDPEGLYRVITSCDKVKSFTAYSQCRKNLQTSEEGRRVRILEEQGRRMQSDIDLYCKGEDKERMQKEFDEMVVTMDPNIDDPNTRSTTTYATTRGNVVTFNYGYFEGEGTSNNRFRYYVFAHEFRHTHPRNQELKNSTSQTGQTRSWISSNHDAPYEVDADEFATNWLNGECNCE